MKIHELQDKRIAIVGYGVEGQATAHFLLRRTIPFAIHDRNPRTVIPEEILQSPLLTRSVLGEDYLQDLSAYDVIIRAPGIRPFLPELVAFKERGGIMETQIRLFFENYAHPERIIGVTGTKGKGTTVLLIERILKQAGLPVRIGGNIGSEVLSLLDEGDASDGCSAKNLWVVLELSSFQLQDCEASPHIAVILMVTSDHQDYHQGIAEYVAAKSAIGRYQSADDMIVVNADYASSMEIAKLSKAHRYQFSTVTAAIVGDEGATALAEEGNIVLIHGGEKRTLGKMSELQLRGHHNTQNICAAAIVGTLVGVDDADIWSACSSFSGYAHRLQFVTQRDGISFYDDSIATVPESALTAADSFTEPLILFVGGSDKGENYEQFGRELAKRHTLKAVVAVGAVGPRIASGLRDAHFSGAICEPVAADVSAYDEAFRFVADIGREGDVVLLSPGTASFGMFKNYKERGDIFSAHAQDFHRATTARTT